MQKLHAIERARRNPARILYDHPHLGGLVISICDADFTYFEWGDPDDDEEDTTPTRWYAEVSWRRAIAVNGDSLERPR